MSRLVGTWRLVEWTASVDGRAQRPFGGDVSGLLTYTDDGRMWAALMRQDREPLTSTTFAGAVAAERASASAGYLNYAGTYTAYEDRVIHHVELALMPNWVGDDQERLISWLDGDLELSTPPEQGRSGAVILNRLRWRRVEAEDEMT